jgi:nucleoside-diphosphate-sugar epimerase
MIKKAIISGASGFIGKALTKKLLLNGVDVTTIVRYSDVMDEFQDFPNFHIIRLDFDRYQDIPDFISAKGFDIFFYLAWAGYGKTTNDYQVQIANIKPVSDAIIAASKIGCKRFLFTSSFSEFMVLENEEKTHLNGAASNVYGSAKKAARIIAHSVAKQVGIEFLSIAFANTYGPGDLSRRSTNMIIKKLLDNSPVDLTMGIHLYDWNFIDDAINGLLLAAEKGKSDELYYIGRQLRPLKDIIFEVRDIVNINGVVNLGLYKEDFHVDYSSIDVNKLYRDTGYLPLCNFKQSIIDTINWIKNNDF